VTSTEWSRPTTRAFSGLATRERGG
jgi:hypothetical protein